MSVVTRLSRVMGLLAMGYAMFFGVASVSAQSTSPSFDCSKATGDVEKLICNDEDLARLDRKLADVYEKALERFPAE